MTSTAEARLDDANLNATEVAEELFRGGSSCVRAVLEATTGVLSPELVAATSGFSSGIGESGCLCGAVTGGVMALGLKGQGKSSGELISVFKKTFGTSCCRGLSKDYEWMSEEHQDNCCRITAATAGMVEELLLDR